MRTDMRTDIHLRCQGAQARVSRSGFRLHRHVSCLPYTKLNLPHHSAQLHTGLPTEAESPLVSRSARPHGAGPARRRVLRHGRQRYRRGVLHASGNAADGVTREVKGRGGEGRQAVCAWLSERRRFESWADVCWAVMRAMAYWNAHKRPSIRGTAWAIAPTPPTRLCPPTGRCVHAAGAPPTVRPTGDVKTARAPFPARRWAASTSCQPTTE